MTTTAERDHMWAVRKLTPEPGLDLVETPVPTVGDDDVLIRVEAAIVCRTDKHIFHWDDWAANSPGRSSRSAATCATSSAGTTSRPRATLRAACASTAGRARRTRASR